MSINIASCNTAQERLAEEDHPVNEDEALTLQARADDPQQDLSTDIDGHQVVCDDDDGQRVDAQTHRKFTLRSIHTPFI